MRPRSYVVILSDHAWDRWLERGYVKTTRKKLQLLVKAKVNNALAPGIELDKTGAGEVTVMPGILAKLRITDHGLLVTTFYNREEQEVVV